MRALTAKEVHIIDARGQVDEKRVHVNGTGEELTWFAHGNENATIVFTASQGSPFQQSVFLVPAGGSVSTGGVTDSAKYNVPYKYTVVGPVGSNDPEVIIER
jgi:hypothetical protein